MFFPMKMLMFPYTYLIKRSNAINSIAKSSGCGKQTFFCVAVVFAVMICILKSFLFIFANKKKEELHIEGRKNNGDC